MAGSNLNIGPLSVPLRVLWGMFTGPLRLALGIPNIEKSLVQMGRNMETLLEILTTTTAHASADWADEQRERVLGAFSRFVSINQGLGRLKPTGNPITADDIARLKEYTRQAQENRPFTEPDARDFMELAKLVNREGPNEEWVGELMKVAIFVFSYYVVAKMLKETA